MFDLIKLNELVCVLKSQCNRELFCVLLLSNAVCSLIKLKLSFTGFWQILLKQEREFCCFYGAMLDLYRENIIALGSESCSSWQESESDSCVQQSLQVTLGKYTEVLLPLFCGIFL